MRQEFFNKKIFIFSFRDFDSLNGDNQVLNKLHFIFIYILYTYGFFSLK